MQNRNQPDLVSLIQVDDILKRLRKEQSNYELRVVGDNFGVGIQSVLPLIFLVAAICDAAIGEKNNFAILLALTIITTNNAICCQPGARPSHMDVNTYDLDRVKEEGNAILSQYNLPTVYYSKLLIEKLEDLVQPLTDYKKRFAALSSSHPHAKTKSSLTSYFFKTKAPQKDMVSLINEFVGESAAKKLG